jgi:hypothetical protein
LDRKGRKVLLVPKGLLVRKDLLALRVQRV